MQDDIFGLIVFGNTVGQYAISLGILLGGALLIKLFESIVLRRARARAAATETKVDDVLVGLIDRAVLPVLFFVLFYLSVQHLKLHPKVERGIWLLGVSIFTYVGARLLSAILTAYFEHFWGAHDPARKESIRRLMPFARALIWVSATVFLLDNLGFRVSAVVAGLGIGGVAVALAAQAILGDLFSYFAIMLDRPFYIGEVIMVGEFSGAVEHIGIKTTRLRSQSGEQLIVPNKDLTGSRLRNLSKLQGRGVQVTVGVTYQTPEPLVSAIPSIVQSVVSGIDSAQFERCHLKSLSASSLDYEIVFQVAGNDYNKYMDALQAFNIALLREFRARGIEFAYPTRTVYSISTEG